MSIWGKFFPASGLDSPNKSSNELEEISGSSRAHLTASAIFPGKCSDFVGAAPAIHCVVEDTGATSDERLRQLNYNVAMLLFLKNNGHYYSPDTETSQRDYLRSQFSDSIREAVNAVEFSISMGKRSLSGDMLSEVARALASVSHVENPVYANNLVFKLLRNKDPMVVDSMVVALSDYQPSWMGSSKSLASAVEEIPWPDVRSDALLALGSMEG